ncbi:uncharacterized protein KY384_009022 [Bacidia gigantensis]|uniref:uncharacterized protein n=1 Tax=Bacidia gigantensis TaxID=2732470 RepID=UPI001D046112|nr:uncharacterized protein KY384_009022 [Bacidia gigantensis]KAG8525378.1 hypothetical protein KY384_009022 [Bacidia gigantensis]
MAAPDGDVILSRFNDGANEILTSSDDEPIRRLIGETKWLQPCRSDQDTELLLDKQNDAVIDHLQRCINNEANRPAEAAAAMEKQIKQSECKDGLNTDIEYSHMFLRLREGERSRLWKATIRSWHQVS